MAIFVATVDPSPDRRKRFLKEHAKGGFGTFYSAPVSSFERGDLAVVSCTQAWEPFRCTESPEAIAFVWGHAMEQGCNTATQANIANVWRGLRNECRRPSRESTRRCVIAPTARRSPERTCSASRPSTTLAEPTRHPGFEPELFRSHPDFVAELELPAGLAGVLLSNGLIGGRPLLRRVRRLDSGALLLVSRDRTTREFVQYRREMSDRYFGDSFEKNYARMTETLDDCFARHLDPRQAYTACCSPAGSTRGS